MVEQTRWTFGLRSCRTRGVCELCRYDKYVCAGTIGRRKGVRGTSGHGLLGFEHRGEEGVHCRHTGQKDEQGSEILRTSEAGRRRKRRMHTSQLGSAHSPKASPSTGVGPTKTRR